MLHSSYKTDSSLKGEDYSMHPLQNSPSVKLILLDCHAFDVCTELFYEVYSLKEFSIILPEKVLQFLSYVNCVCLYLLIVFAMKVA